ncbi:hypothetical protein FYJ26_09940 [Anaerococcus sp. WCA-380-WT-2B]|uniref:SH3 domain-containing protein n=1 Tax=Anaerococcus porci TaxID=2652269 RepID=A0A6N7VGY6_9FIRM|nr:hypothetical protein [Anaerococcus porci]MSS78698.1 hypothetical protein [Anaerococcus porci]
MSFFLIILLSSCSDKKEVLVLKENEQKKEYLSKNSQKEFQIDGLYLVNKDTFMYDRKDEKSVWDKIKKGSSVKVLSEAEDGFIRVDYFGNEAFMKTEDLDIDS